MPKVMKKTVFFIISLLLLAVMYSCKPTEKNYREAYESAKSKREQADADLNLPATGLQSMDGPRLVPVNGDTVYYNREKLGTSDVDSIFIDRYNVVVASYRMVTNARRQVSDLQRKFKGAYAARVKDDKWYVVAATFPEIGEAVKFINDYKRSHPDGPFVGLPGSPVIIEQR